MLQIRFKLDCWIIRKPDYYVVTYTSEMFINCISFYRYQFICSCKWVLHISICLYFFQISINKWWCIFRVQKPARSLAVKVISSWKLFFATCFLYLAYDLKYSPEVEQRLFINWILGKIYMASLCQLAAHCFCREGKTKTSKCIFFCIFFFLFKYLYTFFLFPCFIYLGIYSFCSILICFFLSFSLEFGRLDFGVQYRLLL